MVLLLSFLSAVISTCAQCPSRPAYGASYSTPLGISAEYGIIAQDAKLSAMFGVTFSQEPMMVDVVDDTGWKYSEIQPRFVAGITSTVMYKVLHNEGNYSLHVTGGMLFNQAYVGGTLGLNLMLPMRTHVVFVNPYWNMNNQNIALKAGLYF